MRTLYFNVTKSSYWKLFYFLNIHTKEKREMRPPYTTKRIYKIKTRKELSMVRETIETQLEDITEYVIKNNVFYNRNEKVLVHSAVAKEIKKYYKKYGKSLVVNSAYRPIYTHPTPIKDGLDSRSHCLGAALDLQFDMIVDNLNLKNRWEVVKILSQYNLCWAFDPHDEVEQHHLRFMGNI